MTFVDPALLLALMLLAGITGGYAGVLVRVPRVVGYLAGGVALHYLLRLVPEVGDYGHSGEKLVQAASQLQGLKPLALGLIMFSIGQVFEIKHVRAVGIKVLRLVFLMETGVFLLVGTAIAVLAWHTRGDGPSGALAFGLLLGAVATATAPAATLLVLREYEAKGSNTDAVLSMTAVNNIACVILFHFIFLVLSASGIVESAYGADRHLWLDLLLTSVGSMVLGVALGFVFSMLYAKITIADFMLIFLGVMLLLGVFEDYLSRSLHLSFNFLLVFLFLGAAFTNITPDQDAFHKALHTISGPIYVLFFVLAGLELHVGELANLGWIGAAYLLFRVLGKSAGGWLGARWVHAPGEIYPYIGFGMLCQAGVAIGLADFLSTTWGTRTAEGFLPTDAAKAFKTVILGSVVVFELIGPVALKLTAVRAGEVKAVTLLRRRRTPGNQSGSVLRRTWDALLLTLRFGRPRRSRPVADLQTRHIMRSGIKVLPASARFDEVLHFAEHNRLNHFPVVDGNGRYVGMIHFADLRHIMYDPTARDLVTAHDLSRTETPIVLPNLDLPGLFGVFHTTEATSLAVVDDLEDRHVIGIVEERDLLLVLRKNPNERIGAEATP